MDETRLFATLDECDRLTGDAVRALEGRRRDARLAERFGCAVGRAPALALRGPVLPGGAGRGRRRPRRRLRAARTSSSSPARPTTAIGLDTAPILDRSDLFPRDGKCQHAFCIDVDREGDVRVLANVEPDRYWADTMLHEFGHGAYDLGFDRSLPWLLRDCHLTTTEGIAMLIGRLARDAEWLRDVAGRRRATRPSALDGRARGRARRGAARLHALGARDDELRARASTPTPTPTSTRPGGTSSSATSC